MSTAEIVRKNLELSASFNTYLFDNPGAADKAATGSSIIFTVEGSPKMQVLNEYNLRLGRDLIKKEKKPVLRAIRKGKTWKIEELKA